MWKNPERFKQYLKIKGLKERTILTYLAEFNKFLALGGLSVQGFYKYLSLPSTQYNKSRSFAKHIKDYLLINNKEFNLNEVQLDQIKLFEVPQHTGRKAFRIPEVLTEDQIKILEENLQGERDKLLLLTCFYCGLRIGELVSIRINSFNWPYWSKDIEAPGEIRVYGKGDIEGVAVCPSFLMKRLARYIRSNTFREGQNSLLFFEEKIKKQSRAKHFQNKLKEAGIKAGITKKNEEGKLIKSTVVNPHKLRHSYATWLLRDKKKDILTIKEALRHKNISNTQIYTHFNKEDLKKALTF